MPFDFHEEFKSYDNIDLLKIVKQPDQYQPAAVEAARELLSQRDISPGDHTAATTTITQQQQKDRRKTLRRAVLQRKLLYTFFEPMMPHTQAQFSPKKWLNLFLLVTGLVYAWHLYNTVQIWLSYFRYAYSFSVSDFLTILDLAYIPLMWWLLLKKKKWGWILLFGSNVFTLITSLTELWWALEHMSYLQTNALMPLLGLLLRGGMAWFLWKKEICDLFGVSARTRKDTLIFFVIFGVLFIIALFINY